MGRPTHVYANGNEIATKATTGQASACFPDVCFSPPPPPPAPKIGVPVPYPNTCFARDLTKGSRTVLIRRKLIAKEDKSYFRTSYGDEPATPAFKKGLITSKIKGKCYFVRWSPNVKVESKCVDRHCDMVTHNHSNPPNALLQAYIARQSMDTEKCRDDKKKIDDNCGPKPDSTQPPEKYNWVKEHCGDLAKRQSERSNIDSRADTRMAKKDPCLNARKCQLVPYSSTSSHKKTDNPKQGGCCPGQTGHHLLPDGMFRKPENKAAGVAAWVAAKPGRDPKKMPRDHLPKEDCWDNYSEGAGLTICAEGGNPGGGSHDDLHKKTKKRFRKYLGKQRTMPFSVARDSVAAIVAKKFRCKASCIAEQLDVAYGPMRSTSEDCAPLASATVVAHSGMSGDGKRAMMARNPQGHR